MQCRSKIPSISSIYSRPVNLLFRHTRGYYYALSKSLPFLVFSLIAERAGKIARKLNSSVKEGLPNPCMRSPFLAFFTYMMRKGLRISLVLVSLIHQAQVVQKVNIPIHLRNLYPEDNAIGHFRVSKNLTFKRRLSAKPLL